MNFDGIEMIRVSEREEEERVHPKGWGLAHA